MIQLYINIQNKFMKREKSTSLKLSGDDYGVTKLLNYT